ncbi:MAG: TRAP transporter small permease [Oceanospirillaceae bacterium]
MDNAAAKKNIAQQLINLIATTCTLISGLSLVTLTLTFGWLVYGRYILNSTPTWVEQLALLLIITITFLSSAVGIKERTHLAVDILPQMCSPKVQLLFRIGCDLVLAGFGLLLALMAIELIEFSWYKRIPLLDIPEGIKYLPVTLSGSLLVIFSLNNIRNSVARLRSPDCNKRLSNKSGED